MAAILVIDDDISIRTMLREYLTEKGYTVATATNGREGLFVARESNPDLVLLDIMMPEMDGHAFINNFRTESNAPVILLTARVDESDKVEGLDLGADDYVTKPFSLKELNSRIQAVLRRSHAASDPTDVIRAFGITLDRSRRTVVADGKGLALTPTEFELLASLMEAPGRVHTRASLLENLHRYGIDGVERTIDVHVRNLRAKLEPDSRNPRYVLTVHGIGYRFADV